MISAKFYADVNGWPRYKGNIVENFNLLSRAHERYRQTTDRRQTDGRKHIANVNSPFTFAKNGDFSYKIPNEYAIIYQTY